jgi:alpha-mannosidase
MTHRQHQHPHLHADDYIAWHQHHAPNGPVVSRRSFLQGSAAALAGALTAKVDRLFGTSLASFQTDPKRIYLAPDDHTDLFWSGDDAQYQTWFLQMLDYYLNQADNTASNPADYQSRWNCDGSFWMWTYEKNRTSTQFARLINRIRDGHISVPLNALCVCLGGAPTEAVLRGMYYPGKIERQSNLRFRLAYLMENQTQPYGIGALWAGSGAKYSWKGICDCATQVPNAWDREHDIYWWVGPDGSKVLIKWNSMLSSGQSQSIGGYAEARDPVGVVNIVDTNTSFIARYPYRIIGAFGQGWDDTQTMNQAIVSAAQTTSNANRRVIVSNEQDFFADFEAANGASLPSVACTFGNEWELDTVALAEPAARVKRAVEKLRAAEALATLVTLRNPSFMDSRVTARDLAWMDLGLYWEHDMAGAPDAGLTTKRIAWQKKLALEIETYVNTLHTDAVAALGGLIQESGTNSRFFVFNPLSWSRTDMADFPYAGPTPIHVIDLDTNAEVPSQIVSIGGAQYVRVLASNVPSVGYKVFEIQSGAGQDWAAGAPSANGSVIQNDFYQVTVANQGAITSLIDKTRSNREFAQTIGGRAINDLGADTGSLTVENAGPVSVTLLASAPGPTPFTHTTRVTLLRGSPRIDIRNDINQNFDATNWWAFGFNLTAPDLMHEEVGAIISAKLTTSGGHYSPRNARYDWLTLNHFADLTGGGVGVTLSNADCYYTQRGNSTVTTLDATTPQIKVLVGGRAPNNFSTISNQGGDAHFLQRFALTTHDAYDQVAAMRFALEHQNPFVTGPVTGGTAYPATSLSLVNISNSNVLLWALKPHDDGIAQGVIARVWNLASAQSAHALTLPPAPILSAVHVTHIETPLVSLPVVNNTLSDTLMPQQMKTYALSVTSDVIPTPTPAPTPTITPTPSPTPILDKKNYLPLIQDSDVVARLMQRMMDWWDNLCRFFLRH